jgi:nucleoid-associated protein YgaU
MIGRRLTRYPLQIEQAAPGKLVRTRTRHVPAASAPTPSPTPTPTSGQPSLADAKDAVPYLARTLLPLASSFNRQTTYTIQAGDRLDNVSARLLGDPMLYWMLLEANNVSDPAMLCASPGRKIIVPALVGQSGDPFDQPQASRRGTAAAPTDQTDDLEESA